MAMTLPERRSGGAHRHGRDNVREIGDGSDGDVGAESGYGAGFYDAGIRRRTGSGASGGGEQIPRGGGGSGGVAARQL